jgi:hypothetical protein
MITRAGTAAPPAQSKFRCDGIGIRPLSLCVRFSAANRRLPPDQVRGQAPPEISLIRRHLDRSPLDQNDERRSVIVLSMDGRERRSRWRDNQPRIAPG